MALKAKQRLFVAEYLKDRNASRAYQAAGYPGRGADQSASRLLKNAKVAEAIEKGLARLGAKLDLSAERVLQRIAEIAFYTPKAKTSDVLRACEMLGKHFKLFTDVQEIAGKDGGGPQIILTMPANGSESEHRGPH